MANFLEPKLKPLKQPVLPWVLLIAFFAALIVVFGLSIGHKLAQRQAETLEFVRSYQVVNTHVAPRTVRVVLER